MMFSKTKRVLFAALMFGAASSALASDGSNYSDGTEMRSRAHATGAPKSKRQVTPRTFGANSYRSLPAPSRQPEAEWPRMNCDMPIGC
jgi:hypothetical protein